MSVAKHTPGPWSVFDRRTTSEIRAGETTIADVRQNGQGNANAQLIAAAPQMLLALKVAEPWLGKLIADGGHLEAAMPNHAVRALEMVVAAIAQATEG
jgi:hypothetical protein